MNTFALAITFFLIANPIGNVPLILSLIKNYDFKKQQVIMLRESLFAFLLAIFFQYCGEGFLTLLKIKNYTLSITGGLVLFIAAIQMIFSKPENPADLKLKTEPFIVPISIPLITGPGLIAMIMLTATGEPSHLKVSTAILVAFIGVTIVLFSGPFLQKIFGKRGISAIEKVMGMISGLISMQMMESGARMFVKSLSIQG